MAGLVPATHAVQLRITPAKFVKRRRVDGRIKSGHDTTWQK